MPADEVSTSSHVGLGERIDVTVGDPLLVGAYQTVINQHHRGRVLTSYDVRLQNRARTRASVHSFGFLSDKAIYN